MFTPQTEAALAANLSAEAGQPWAIALTAEVYRELVYAARQWDAMRAGVKMPTAAVPLYPSTNERWEFSSDGTSRRVG